MTLFLIVVHVIVCFVLILVILLQAGRGQGLTGPTFASGNVQSLLGTRAGDFLTKATSVSAILFLFTCVGLNVIEARKSRSLLEVKRADTSPIDLDAIKKALEQVKAEKASAVAKPSTDAAATRATTSAEPVPAVAVPTAAAPAAQTPAAPTAPAASSTAAAAPVEQR